MGLLVLLIGTVLIILASGLLDRLLAWIVTAWAFIIYGTFYVIYALLTLT